MNKYIFEFVSGTIATAITYLFGGWNGVLSTLILFMILDYVSGLLVAGVFHNSKKTENGKLSSGASIKGIIKKIFTLFLVCVAFRIDIILGAEGSLLMTVEYFLIANEALSILENAASMGIPLPEKLKNALEVLKEGD